MPERLVWKVFSRRDGRDAATAVSIPCHRETHEACTSLTCDCQCHPNREHVSEEYRR